MSRYQQLDVSNIKTYSISDRQSKLDTSSFSRIPADNSMSAFLDSLPDVLFGKQFKEFIAIYKTAIARNKPVIWMMGAHVLKSGLSPLIIDLMQKKLISHLALNGAGAIHDVEIANWGQTSEDVAKALQDGSFGMCRETAAFINDELNAHADDDLGYGETIGEKLLRLNPPNVHLSVVANCVKENIPLSVHSAIGTEIIQQHPNFDGAAAGKKAEIDFRIFTNSVAKLSKDALVVSFGSAVILPEVFLKALTVVRNLGYDAHGFHTAVFDMIKHYRPMENIVRRPTYPDGKGYYFVGCHELMLPLVYNCVVQSPEF